MREEAAVRKADGVCTAEGKLAGAGERTNAGRGARKGGIVRPACAAEDNPVAGFTGVIWTGSREVRGRCCC